MTPTNVVYLNGAYVPAESATVSIDDRGFLFADAVYEATAVFGGHPFVLDLHLARLQRGLDELRIDVDVSHLADVHHELIRRNELGDSEVGQVYVQISRGVAPRRHQFPVDVTPTVLVRTSRFDAPTDESLAAGTCAITHPDIRWGRVDIKTVGLLANVLAQQAALDAGVDDVILHRDGCVTEGSRTNVFGVVGGSIVTAIADTRILPGVTRSIVIDLAREGGHDVVERDWSVGELRLADEVFMTSTMSGVRAIVGLDGAEVGSGCRGPVTEALQQRYAARVGAPTTPDARGPG